MRLKAKKNGKINFDFFIKIPHIEIISKISVKTVLIIYLPKENEGK
jgi:hypothetical protein